MANYLTTDTELTSVANAIRTKGGTVANLTYPTGFVSAINAIPTGGGSVDPAWLTFTGDLQWFNNNGVISQFLYDNRNSVSITTYNLGISFVAIPTSGITDFSFLTVNVPSNATTLNIKSIGYSSETGSINYLSKLPNITLSNDNQTILLGEDSFHNCAYLTSLDNLPDGKMTASISIKNVFNNCERLRSLSNVFAPLLTGSAYTYNGWFSGCKILDRVENIPVLNNTSATLMGSGFASLCSNCNRIDRITFATDNGTPYDINVSRNLNWDLTSYVGYSNTELSNYGIPSGKEVTDQTTYEALKNDPDWWTRNVVYSRFNHDSAVALINSLPNNVNTSTKVTIQFNGNSGANTDGGAINTLTAEEIAVATNKNWIISIV